MDDLFVAFIRACLNDDHGINESAYAAFTKIRIAAAGEAFGIPLNLKLSNKLNALNDQVNAVEGRFYISGYETQVEAFISFVGPCPSEDCPGTVSKGECSHCGQEYKDR